MGYEVGAVKYFIGMLTSAWGIITAYLFADGLLHPMDYIQAVVIILSNLNKPEEVLRGILNIVVVSPSEFIRLVLVGLTLMTALWYFGSKFD